METRWQAPFWLLKTKERVMPSGMVLDFLILSELENGRWRIRRDNNKKKEIYTQDIPTSGWDENKRLFIFSLFQPLQLHVVKVLVLRTDNWQDTCIMYVFLVTRTQVTSYKTKGKKLHTFMYTCTHVHHVYRYHTEYNKKLHVLQHNSLRDTVPVHSGTPYSTYSCTTCT